MSYRDGIHYSNPDYGGNMKKVVVLVVVILGFVVSAAFAGGDKNCIQHRGDKGHSKT